MKLILLRLFSRSFYCDWIFHIKETVSPCLKFSSFLSFPWNYQPKQSDVLHGILWIISFCLNKDKYLSWFYPLLNCLRRLWKIGKNWKLENHFDKLWKCSRSASQNLFLTTKVCRSLVSRNYDGVFSQVPNILMITLMAFYCVSLIL